MRAIGTAAVALLAAVLAFLLWSLACEPRSGGEAVPADPAQVAAGAGQEPAAQVAPPPREPLPAAASPSDPPARPPDLPAILVAVRDWNGAPVAGARVLFAERELARHLTIAELVAESPGTFAFDGTTDPRGEAVVAYASGVRYDVRVEGPDGAPTIAGERTLRAPRSGPLRLEYTVGRWFAAAFRLADGAEALQARISLSGDTASLARGRAQLVERVAARLGVPESHVGVELPLDPCPDSLPGSVAVYHERIGWFGQAIAFTPLPTLEVAVLAVPEHGTGPPVRVTIECLDPDGARFPLPDLFLRSDELPWSYPIAARVVASDTPVLVPRGSYLVIPTLPGSSAAMLEARRNSVQADTTIRVRFRWRIAPLTLRLTRAGREFEGPAAVEVRVEGGAGSLGRLQLLAHRGRIRLGLRGDRAATVAVTVRGATREVEFPASGCPAELHLAF